MSYRIAEAAGLVGVPATTLRYYEDIGLIERPARSGNGYRTYDDADLARLRFITATKNLGVPLTEVAELARAFDVEDCSTVAHQVVEAVAERLAQTQTRIGELVALAAQLQTVQARLAEAPTAGPCSDTCPCTTTGEPGPGATRAAQAPTGRPRTLVPLTLTPVASDASDDVVIACSLDAGAVPERVADWQSLVGRALRREAIPGGMALVLPASPELAVQVAGLAAAEQACCTFFTFTLQMTTGEIRLEVRAPEGAAEVVAAMFGSG